MPKVDGAGTSLSTFGNVLSTRREEVALHAYVMRRARPSAPFSRPQIFTPFSHSESRRRGTSSGHTSRRRATSAGHTPSSLPRGGPVRPDASIFVPRRVFPSRGGPMRPKVGLLLQGGPVRPEAGLSVPRRAGLSRGGPFRPEADPFVPRRAYLFRGGYICPEAGLSVPRRT